MRLIPTRGMRSFYTRALYSRGQFSSRVGGFKARFHMIDSGDYEHLAGPMFEREQIEHFLNVLREDDILYEIGGHIGTWSVFMAQRLTAGRLVVFEPEPRNNDRLAKNLALNSLSNVSLMKVAASDENGTAGFGVHARNSDGRHSLVLNDAHANVIQVPTLRLDDAPATLNVPPPTALKIDCEGAELRVLQGATGLLASGQIKTIFIEAHGVQLAQLGKTTDDVSAVLTNAGFQPIIRWTRENEVISILQRK